MSSLGVKIVKTHYRKDNLSIQRMLINEFNVY